MASQEDVDEINAYLQQHAQKQAAKGVEQKNLFTTLQHALFGETHADYAPPVPPSSPVAPTMQSPPAPATIPAAAPTPPSVPRVVSDPSPKPSAPKPAPAAIPKTPSPAVEASREMVATNPKNMTTVSMASEPAVVPEKKINTRAPPAAPTPMPYKFSEETDTAALSPPPARFNPYPNPYRKAIPSPEKFSDSTAPPWVMRTLPSESRDIRKEADTPAPSPTPSEQSLSSRPPVSKKELNTPAAPTPTRAPEKSPASTRVKMMELVNETSGTDGNNSPHRMPWHPDTSGEVTPNELVGLQSTPVAKRPAPVTPSPPREMPVRPTTPMGLNAHEHDYLLRKEQEYDSTHAAVPAPMTTTDGNTTSDEKRAILGRLKELMAQHGGQPPQN
ncbi:MAG: hypothetical protein IPJ89_01755 [Candidatus Iainarchaeum archaeon]|uniref:Uncharacterized protein n=1 Tax=Candidatus Iainarchaeum sp. TaxID=3101447 RepID=A0A7T9DKG4_9ARCH|nr:MAG: hypothetical protein IPJ89_01755 [Candidatus Diapherotrites archaeon]